MDTLSVQQTTTGYWVVQRGAVQLAGAVTREAAEAERDMRERLHERDDWRHALLDVPGAAPHLPDPGA